MPAVLLLLRPKHWTKNILVLAPWIFTAGWTKTGTLLPLALTFAALCLLSSASYVLNDLRDVERDRAHPTKQRRPLASGAVSAGGARVLLAVCLAGGIGLALVLSGQTAVVLGAFALLQAVYNFFAKRQPVLDVSVISLGYVLRPVAGAMAIGVVVSGWLVFCTGAVALLLVTAKRRQEFMSLGAESVTRPALAGYTQPILDAMVIVSASTAILSYGVYAIESPTAAAHPNLLHTVPFVVYGVLRYLYLVFGQERGEDPENVVFADPHMALTLLLFVASAVFAMVTN